MGFREAFISGYWYTPGGQRTFAQWSIEDAVRSGSLANRLGQLSLGQELASAFRIGARAIADSQMESARILQSELRHQADNIVSAIESGTSEIVSSIQATCAYLGGQLCELRWAIERNTRVSEQILAVLVDSLDNTSQQYWKQGVRCFEVGEYNTAKERFALALQANVTNYFAYQYLGFVAVHHEDPRAAIENFHLAQKYADDPSQRALACSHLARWHHATSSAQEAAEWALSAAKLAPQNACYSYEAAVYLVRVSEFDQAIGLVERAIRGDWTYWSIAASDESIAPLRDQVEELLRNLREEQRLVARRSLDAFNITLGDLMGMPIAVELEDFAGVLAALEERYAEGTVFAYRDLGPAADQSEKDALRRAGAALDKRIALTDKAQSDAAVDLSRREKEYQKRIDEVKADAKKIEERSLVFPGVTGCLSCAGVGVGGLFGLAYLLMKSHNDPMTELYGFGAALFLLLLLVGLLAGPVRYYLVAQVPSARVRSRIPALEAERDRVVAEARASMHSEIARLEGERAALRRQREWCLQALKK